MTVVYAFIHSSPYGNTAEYMATFLCDRMCLCGIGLILPHIDISHNGGSSLNMPHKDMIQTWPGYISACPAML